MTELLNNLVVGEETGDKCDCCEMSWKARVTGAITCCGVGIIISIFSFLALATGNLSAFTAIYTIGTIVSIAGSFFIAGIRRHLERLKCVAHAVSAACLIAFIVMVFVSTCSIKGTGGTILALICILGQMISITLFTITLNSVMWASAKAILGRCFPCCR